MITVIPSILAKNKNEFVRRLETVRPHFFLAHIDVLNETIIEGHTWADAAEIEPLAGVMKFEVHLMVGLDGYDLNQWNRPWVDSIILHVEAGEIVGKQINLIRSWNKKVFVALNPDTSVEEVTRYFTKVDGVMFMTVDPGAMGRAFKPFVLDRIVAFHKAHPHLSIEADGGITSETLPAVLSSGVTRVVIGSYLNDTDIEDRLLEIIPIVEKHEGK